MIRDEFLKIAAGTNYLHYYGTTMNKPVKIRGIYHNDEDENLMQANTTQALNLEEQSKAKKKKGGTIGGVAGAALAGVPTGIAFGKDYGVGAGLAAGGAAGLAGGALGYFAGRKASGNKEKKQAKSHKQSNTMNFVGIVDKNYKKSDYDRNKMPIPRIEGDSKNKGITKKHYDSATGLAETFKQLDELRSQYNLNNIPSQI